MYKIELTKGGRVIETRPVNSTIDVAEIERMARELQTESAEAADGWRIINDIGRPVKASNT